MTTSKFTGPIFARSADIRDAFVNVYVHGQKHSPAWPWHSQEAADLMHRGSPRFVYRVNVRVREEGAQV